MVNRLFLLNGHPLRFHEATFYQSLTLFSRKRDQTTQKVMTTPLEKLLGLSIYYNRTRSIVLHLCLSIAPTVFSSIIRKCTCHFLVQITKDYFLFIYAKRSFITFVDLSSSPRQNRLSLLLCSDLQQSSFSLRGDLLMTVLPLNFLLG